MEVDNGSNWSDTDPDPPEPHHLRHHDDALPITRREERKGRTEGKGEKKEREERKGRERRKEKGEEKTKKGKRKERKRKKKRVYYYPYY